MDAELMVEVWRGQMVESRHYGHVAVADTDGGLVYHLGNSDKKVFLRSSAKPLQTMAVVMSGAADRFGMTSADLAIATASHTAEPVHLRQVEHLLSLVGRSVQDLQCGAHPPGDIEAAEALRRLGEQPSALHNNCSGKHAAMLGVAEALGGDSARYLDPAAPGQRLVRSIVSRMCSVPEEEIAVAIDGCSAPVFGVPLRAAAVGYARLANPQDLPDDLRTAAARVRDAMLEHPYLIAGRGQVGVDIMRVGHGRLVAKTGAEAVFGVGDVTRGQGLVLKLDDGQTRGVAPALIESLRQAGFLSDAEAMECGRWQGGAQRNFGGLEVGRVSANFRLAPAV
jgi:L-asparaginase II